MSRLSLDATAASVARAFAVGFSFEDVYVADLDAIADRDPNQDQWSAIAKAGLRVSLDAGIGLVLEANFVRGRSEAGLRPLVARAEARQVVCVCDEATRRARFAGRAERGDRHPGHLDRLVLDVWDERPVSVHAALDLSIPTLVVDTGDGRIPDDDEILRFVTSTRQNGHRANNRHDSSS